MNRRSLTPSTGIPAVGLPATRRGSGGARREISSRITLVCEGAELDGWALNISRGGIRVVIEGRVELGQEYEIRDLDPEIAEGGPFMARVVWVQDEPDGAIVGLEFVGNLPKLIERTSSVAPTAPSVQPPAPPPVPPPAPPAEPVIAGPSQPAPKPELPVEPKAETDEEAAWDLPEPEKKG